MIRHFHYILALIGLGFLAAACSTMGATRGWKHVGTTNWGNIEHYINPHSLHKRGSLVFVESKNVFKEPETAAFLQGRKYRYDVDKWEIDCARAQARLLQVDFYSRSNRMLFRQPIENPQLSPIPRESALSQIYANVCR